MTTHSLPDGSVMNTKLDPDGNLLIQIVPHGYDTAMGSRLPQWLKLGVHFSDSADAGIHLHLAAPKRYLVLTVAGVPVLDDDLKPGDCCRKSYQEEHMNEPFLSFSMPLPEAATEDFLTGTLTLARPDGTLLSAKASSGRPGHQFAGNFWTRGHSPCPPDSVIEGGKHSVDLHFITPGAKEQEAEGSRYYHIFPDPQTCAVDATLIRTAIGLHFDQDAAQFPGSAGCIAVCGLTAEDVKAGVPGWNSMKAALDLLAAAGYSFLPLVVQYPEMPVT